MSKLSFFSTHTGANGAGCGAIAAGLVDVGGIELADYPVMLYRQNFGDGIRHESILETPSKELPDFDFLWSSPTCVNFSAAKADGKELELDIAIAQKVAEIVRIKRPRYFALENVRGYSDSESFAAILSRLDAEGYNYHWAIYDAASFGVPQNRNRLILRASRDPLRDLMPTHSKHGGLWWQPWNGWYDAVADLLPSCKPSHLTERQILALGKKGWYGEVQRAPLAVPVDCKGNRHSSDYTRAVRDSPAFGIRASSANQCRALLFERTGYGKERDPTIRTADDPSITIKAAAGCDERGGFRSPLTALLVNADTRALDYRCLARLQSFPSDYKWGLSAGKNCRASGNAIPPLFAQRVIESMVN